LLIEFKKNKTIHRLGFVDDEDLVAIYNLATVYVQPSFYEGFGLPVLEAMACETPVIVSRTNALVEVAGKAALIADPKDADDIANKILKCFDNSSTRLRLKREGKRRVNDFSWEKTAKETLKVYKSVYGQ
jgi:glycosyltransferase involved in cell wall biosynthesis